VFEIVVGESVWMRAVGAKNHEIGDVNNPHTKLWSELAKKGGGDDNLERNLRTNANQDYVWTQTSIGRTKPPDASTSTAMYVCLLCTEPNSRRLLRTNHEVNVIFGVEAMGDRAQEAVSIGWEVNTGGLGLEVENGTDK
jgi:hypothetical protein